MWSSNASRRGSNSGTTAASAPPAMALMSARYPPSLPSTSTTGALWWWLAVSLRRSMACSAVLSAVSTPMAASVPHTSLSMEAGTPPTVGPGPPRPPRPAHAVVYGGRNAASRRPELPQPRRAGQAPVAADDDQGVDAGLLEPPRRPPLPLGRGELLGPPRAKARPPP